MRNAMWLCVVFVCALFTSGCGLNICSPLKESGCNEDGQMTQIPGPNDADNNIVNAFNALATATNWAALNENCSASKEVISRRDEWNEYSIFVVWQTQANWEGTRYFLAFTPYFDDPTGRINDTAAEVERLKTKLDLLANPTNGKPAECVNTLANFKVFALAEDDLFNYFTGPLAKSFAAFNKNDVNYWNTHGGIYGGPG